MHARRTRTLPGVPESAPMTTVERIQQAESQVSNLQEQLDRVQFVLNKVEGAARTGEAVKKNIRLIVAVSVVVSTIVTTLVLVRAIKKRRARRESTTE